MFRQVAKRTCKNTILFVSWAYIKSFLFTEYKNRLALLVQMIPDLQYGCKDK